MGFPLLDKSEQQVNNSGGDGAGGKKPCLFASQLMDLEKGQVAFLLLFSSKGYRYYGRCMDLRGAGSLVGMLYVFL